MTERKEYNVPLGALEATARVPLAEQVEEQAVGSVPEYLAPEDLDRQRLLSPTGDGRLRVR